MAIAGPAGPCAIPLVSQGCLCPFIKHGLQTGEQLVILVLILQEIDLHNSFSHDRHESN